LASLLILDAEALNALAHATTVPRAAARARAILTVAHERSAVIRVPVAVLAEVCRGTARDAAVNRVLHGRGIEVVPMNEAIARRAGALLSAARLDSTCAVDAFVVATAVTLGGGVIATHDPDDLARLSVREPTITIWPI
jgi:predicted nucleic acid-binding protein